MQQNNRWKQHGWQVFLGVSLVTLSALFYYIHYLIFDDAHHIFIYMVGDVAFVFVEVLLVSLIIQRVLTIRDRRSRLDKLNMVIGAFYAEAGTDLLKTLSARDNAIEQLRPQLAAKGNQALGRLALLRDHLATADFELATDDMDWASLKAFLVGKRDFLLRLLENPNLLEHESFTDVLWAVFHLTEELHVRESLHGLPASDYRHLGGDAKRAYRVLATQWLAYMQHLRVSYPYLFSLSLRTNPFDQSASPVVTDAS